MLIMPAKGFAFIELEEPQTNLRETAYAAINGVSFENW